MFDTSDIQKLDRSYFNIIVQADYDVMIQSKNTGHIWCIRSSGNRKGGECIIFHKHEAFHPFHKHGKAKGLCQAVWMIKRHDVFQMNGRKYT